MVAFSFTNLVFIMFENLFAHRGLSMDRLRALLEVAQAGSISKAVRGDPVRQSQYSRQIAELEEFFGAELTCRRGKVLQLTPKGRELARLVSAHYAGLDDFKTGCANVPRRFSIAAGDSIEYWLVSSVLGAAANEKKPWRFSLLNLRNDAIAHSLLETEADFGILRKSAVVSDVLRHRDVAQASYAVYAPAALVPPARRKDGVWCLQNLPITTLGPETSFYSQLQNLCAENGVALEVAQQTQSFPFAAHLAQCGHHASILPDMAAPFLGKNMVRVPVPFFKKLTRALVLAWNPRAFKTRPCLEEVVAFFLKHLPSP